MTTSLEELRTQGEINALDQNFARTLARLAGEERPEVILAAALASRQLRAGHVGWDIERWVAERGEDPDAVSMDCPETRAWLQALAESPLVESVVTGAAGAGDTPLVLEAGRRLYLRRYWEYQQRLASALRARMADGSAEQAVDAASLESGLARLFADSDSDDLQRLAARTAVCSRFCVLSGGPGTGKTSTVGRILVLLIEQARAQGRDDPRIQLAAPTGKAAAHLSVSLERTLSALDVEDDVRAAVPKAAATLHRCLGASRQVGRPFRHGLHRPLAADVILVDEASMVDLALMTQLVEASPAHAHLILLGDRDQLASVEAGAVLGDIARPAREEEAGSAIVLLKHSYRFEAESGVGQLTQAINAGDVEQALLILDDPAYPDVGLIEPDAEGQGQAALVEKMAEGYAPFLEESDPAACLQAFDGFRVLSAYRHGVFGVDALNRALETRLGFPARLDPASEFYRGRPLAMTGNDYELELYNGDVGVVMEEPRASGRGGRAVFSSPEGEPRWVSTQRLGSAETVFAMSIHKSQGSEFTEVMVVLPTEDSLFLTRELIYTAVSRARERVTLVARRDVLKRAITRRVERSSGLSDALWGARDRGDHVAG